MKTNAIDFYDKLGKRYDMGYNSSYWKLEREVSLAIIKRYVNKHHTLLDLGAGTGIYTQLLKKHVKKIIGVEPAQTMRNIFRERNPNVEIYNASAESLPLNDNTVDVIIAMGDVLSYTENLSQSLREIHRVLTPNGLLIASVDNFHFFLKDIYKHGTRIDIQRIQQTQLVEVGTHHLHFTSRTFRWNELQDMAIQYNFYHKETFFKLVSHSENDDIPDISKALTIELQLNREVSFAGCAEHIMFVWGKRK